MLIDPLFALFCSQIGSMTPGNAQVPCQNVLTATSEQSKTTQTINELQSYSEHFVYKNVNNELLKTSIALGYLINSYNEKVVRAQFPINSFEINLNIGLFSQSGGVKYKYEWK